ncbi:MAG: hypothetical protein JO271_18570 [Verrucomicrobia bacterium]|nr:hypothetical protein [Verrucomicrobiota bacterium]
MDIHNIRQYMSYKIELGAVILSPGHLVTRPAFEKASESDPVYASAPDTTFSAAFAQAQISRIWCLPPASSQPVATASFAARIGLQLRISPLVFGVTQGNNPNRIIYQLDPGEYITKIERPWWLEKQQA